ncbi:PREDICTED: NADH dehydrogenase [ubiquinone] 1 beta subcomplex subunit 9-like [Branchiostoma belcheri]|uniref:NADH dehydrogenase [ubiquinone] 1 beta subcomplex subunit 9 n=1 Tax=Branchiostoma belcheri TaxID=7741 RepID=A0A6P4ZGV6_BRABE|nr:PREDICTED: NADH dehydrogenase [ubiquinone] 1 beta subcomplex subunit 9-like [Branchiostoma belcheri]
MATNPASYLSHAQRVCRLYKRASRHLESWCVMRDKFRYEATLLRARFDEHKDEVDMVKAVKLLKAGEEEFLQRQHPQPYIFPDSPGGTTYERYQAYQHPDWLLDHWHPSERARYPEYFKKREQRLKLVKEAWEKEQREKQDKKYTDDLANIK